jgi:hypothetical protein
LLIKKKIKEETTEEESEKEINYLTILFEKIEELTERVKSMEKKTTEIHKFLEIEKKTLKKERKEKAKKRKRVPKNLITKERFTKILNQVEKENTSRTEKIRKIIFFKLIRISGFRAANICEFNNE